MSVALTLHSKPVTSVFELLGTKENDITYSLGWALSQSPSLCRDLLRKVFPHQNEIQIEAIRLQEHQHAGGFTDIELIGPQAHVIIEAKRGWQVPGKVQLNKYADRLRRSEAPLKALVAMSECKPEFAAKGGNNFWVSYDNRPVNLHSFWDSVLGESKSADRVKEKAEALRKRKGLRRDDLAEQLKVDTVAAWATESAAIAKSVTYLDGKLQSTPAETKPPSAPALPKGYVTAAETEADTRATLAGYRLADRLNRLFDPESESKPIPKRPVP